MENRWSMIQRMVKIHMNGMKLLDTILLGETDNVRMEVVVVCYIIWKKCILLKTHSFCHTKLIILFHSQRLSLSVMYHLPILDIPFYDTLDKHLTLYSWEKKAYTLWVFISDLLVKGTYSDSGRKLLRILSHIVLTHIIWLELMTVLFHSWNALSTFPHDKTQRKSAQEAAVSCINFISSCCCSACCSTCWGWWWGWRHA